MPKPNLSAAGEAMPTAKNEPIQRNVTRRTTLVLAAAVPAIVAGTAAEAGPSLDLDALIETQTLAEKRWLAAMEAEEAFPCKDKHSDLYVSLSIGGGQSVSVEMSDDLPLAAERLREDIIKRYKSETQRTLTALQRVSPELAEKATATLRSARTKDIRSIRKMVREEEARREASGYAAIEREYTSALEAEERALNAIFAYRCRTADEMAKKARFIRQVLPGCILNDGQVDLLLGSMIDEGAGS